MTVLFGTDTPSHAGSTVNWSELPSVTCRDALRWLSNWWCAKGWVVTNTSDHIDLLVDRFSREWIQGSRRSLEEFLAEADPSLCGDLFAELLLMELELRVALGEVPSMNDYAGRFPERGEQVAQVFADFREISRDLPPGWSEGIATLQQGDSTVGASGLSDRTNSGSASRDGPLAVPLEEFRQQLAEFKLLPPEILSKFSQSPSRSARSLARDLVRQKYLTRFQAEFLLRGQGKKLKVGKYLLEEVLGEGGMGRVYRGRNPLLNKRVAIKEMSASSTHSPLALKRFQREIQLTARVSHPNLVAALDAEEQEGKLYLVIDYLEGVDLSRLIKTKGPMSIQDAENCFRQALEGLGAAHGAGILHRDIKPGNLMRTSTGLVKLLDLGLAIHRVEADTDMGGHQSMTELTLTGAFLGTFDFIAPEQAEDPRNACIESDLYSLGCTLYYLLTGEPPFANHKGFQKVAAHSNSHIPPLEVKRPDVPKRLLEIYRRLLAKTPQERFHSCEEVLAELSRVQDLEVSAQVARSIPDEATEIIAEAPHETVVGVENRSSGLYFEQNSLVRRRRSAHSAIQKQRRLVATVLAIPAVLLAVLAGYWFLGPRSEGLLQVVVDPPDAVVELLDKDGTVTALAQAKGRVAELRAPAGSYTMRVSQDGYQSVVKLVELKLPKTSLSNPIQLDRRGEEEIPDNQVADDLGLWCGTSDYKKWVTTLEVMPPNDQVQAIQKQLRDRNVDFTETIKVEFDATGKPIVLRLRPLNLSDLSPLRALRDLPEFQSLTKLSLALAPGLNQKLKEPLDLRPLRGLPLQELDLSYTSVNDLTPLEGMRLTKLSLTGCERLTSLEALRSLKLKQLSLNHTKSGFDDLDALQEMTSLEELFISHTLVSTLRKLSKLRLTTLDVSQSILSGLEGLNFSTVVKLDCQQSPIDDLSLLRDAKQLMELNCSETRVTDLSPLVNLTKLRYLNIMRLQITDYSPLDSLPDLKKIYPAVKKN